MKFVYEVGDHVVVPDGRKGMVWQADVRPAGGDGRPKFVVVDHGQSDEPIGTYDPDDLTPDFNREYTAVVVSEGEDGSRGVIRVMLVPDHEVNKDRLDELAAYGSQLAKATGFDVCPTMDDVERVFDEMNPPAEGDDE